MSFVDDLMSKFKKVDESERSRLRTVRPSTAEHIECASDNTSLLPTKNTRSKPTSSITSLKAFVKKKTPDEVRAEQAAQRAKNQMFAEQAMTDISREEQ